MLPVWKLLGFILYIVLYFTVLEPYNTWPLPTVKTCFFKVLPVVHLILIVISTSTEEGNHTKPLSYRRYITLGLFLSIAGNIALVYREKFFKLAVIFFSLAQAFYILAFKLRPLGNGPMAASFGVVGISLYVYVTDSTKGISEMKLLILLYAVLITTMAWRSAVQFAQQKTLENFLALAGSLAFITSDTILAIDKWKGSFEMAPFWNMITYYVAQLGITLSACNTHEGKFYSHVVKKKE